MDKQQEEQVCLYGDPSKIVQYMDHSDEKGKPDNACYVPDLVPGVLQLLEINEIMEEDKSTDELLANMDIEKIVQEAESMTKNVDHQVNKQMHRFPDPVPKDNMIDMSKHKFSVSTKKKAMWAAYIFEQWKCIRNFKIK